MQAAAIQAAPEDVRTFIQEYFDAWKGTDEEKILAYYSHDIVLLLREGRQRPHLRRSRDSRHTIAAKKTFW
jgi:ketosteroid isomerase-like protein